MLLLACPIARQEKAGALLPKLSAIFLPLYVISLSNILSDLHTSPEAACRFWVRSSCPSQFAGINDRNRLLFMSATDEELDFVHDNGMDHVTYILIMFRSVFLVITFQSLLTGPASISIAFFMYSFVVFLIHLYSTTGRNAVDTTRTPDPTIEMTPTTIRSKWYARVPNADATYPLGGHHVIGEEEEE